MVVKVTPEMFALKVTCTIVGTAASITVNTCEPSVIVPDRAKPRVLASTVKVNGETPAPEVMWIQDTELTAVGRVQPIDVNAENEPGPPADVKDSVVEDKEKLQAFD